MFFLGCDVCGVVDRYQRLVDRYQRLVDRYQRLVDRYQRLGGLLHPYLAMKIEVERFSPVLITGSRLQLSKAGSYCSLVRNVGGSIISSFCLYQSCNLWPHCDCLKNTRHVCFKVLGNISANLCRSAKSGKTVPNIVWVPSTELGPRHHSGCYSLGVLEYLYTPALYLAFTLHAVIAMKSKVCTEHVRGTDLCHISAQPHAYLTFSSSRTFLFLSQRLVGPLRST